MHKQTNQWNRRETSKVDPSIQRNLVYDKGGISVGRKMSYSINGI